MRSLAKSRYGNIIAPVLALLLPVIIMAAAFMIAQVPPGKILPVEATLRRNPMDEDVICAVTESREAASEIREELASPNSLVRQKGIDTLLAEYMDLFFLLALMTGDKAGGVILFAAYFLRFGLASIAMYYLLKNRIRAGKYFSVMLSVFYACSSIAFLAAGAIQVMNLLILFPLAFAAMDRMIATDDNVVYLRLVLIFALIFISGMPGIICGSVCILMYSFVAAIMRYRTAGNVLASVCRILAAVIPGFMVSGMVSIPAMLSLDIQQRGTEVFSDAAVEYKLFDFLASASSGMAQNSQDGTCHAIYIGIITLVLIIIMFINPNIPVRIKAVTGIVAVICHILTAYSAFNSLIPFADSSTCYPAALLSGLAVVLVIAAAISVKNIRNAGRGVIYGGGLSVIVLMVIANSSENVYGYMNYQLFMTFISAVGVTVFLLHIAENGSRKTGIIYGVLSCIVLTSNMSYVYMMSDMRPEDYRPVVYADGDCDTPELSTDAELSFLTSRDRYLILDSGSAPSEEGRDVPSIINEMCDDMGIDHVFLPVGTSEIMNIGFVKGEDGRFRICEEDSEMIRGVSLLSEERLFFGSGLNAPVHMSELNFNISDLPIDRKFDGPFLYELTNTTGTFEISMRGDPTGANQGYMELYRLDEDALDVFNGMSFDIAAENRVTGGGAKTLLTGVRYSEDIKISVGGTQVAVYEYLGRTAFTIPSDLEGVLEISSRNKGAVPGIALTISGLLCAAGHEIITKRIRRLE
ncbi:membrane protein YfhO [Ruminococcaceae bacterium YRB3002]|nr:membrane protein YfhO [Ruminococcaceae bacterium YRB3002]